MPRQYRVRELTAPVNTFTPEYSDDGIKWNSIGGTTSLTQAGAEQLIDAFIKRGGEGSINEIFHPYNTVKPLFG